LQTEQLKARWLRAERHRRSLVYQKRYLLLLVAGFQDSEVQTLTAIARMGAHPSSRSAGPQARATAGHRFRAAARAVVACSR